MNLDIVEGFIEIKGQHPVLVTATHGFGSDGYRAVAKALRKCLKHFYVKTGYPSEHLGIVARYGSAVDLFTWEIAYKIAVHENVWSVLPTLSKIDSVDGMTIPDYNLNKGYASVTPFWRRVRDIVAREGIRVVIDLHGMKNIKKWPDICISTRGMSTASTELVSMLRSYFAKHGLRVEIDYPFAGGAFISHMGKPPHVEAVAIEIKRNLRFFGSRIPEILRGAITVVKHHLSPK
uniref:N-formylglutamate amidohydrolase n=1 Tax=Ignisphaera aggregans TaxID=334771 RepID=A0A7C2Z943_9CREN